MELFSVSYKDLIFISIQAVSDTPLTDSGGVNRVSEFPDDSDAEEFVSSLIVSPISVLDVVDKVGWSWF